MVVLGIDWPTVLGDGSEMQKIILALATLVSFAVAAFADDLSVEVTNKTSESIKAIAAVPRAGGAPIALSDAEIASGATSELSFEAPASTCVFTVSSTLTSGKVITLPDVFLCHTPKLVIQ